MSKLNQACAFIAALALSVGCVERDPELSPTDRERLAPYLSTEAPSPEHELNVRFENGVSLLGYDLSSESVAPNAPFEITWHWHAEEDLEQGWRLFTHVTDSAGADRLNQDEQGVVRELYQPGRWEAGQYIRDVQSITLPADWGNPRASLYVGVWNGPHRLAIQTGPSDGANRATGPTLEVSGGSPAAAAPRRPAEPPRAPPPATRASRASDIEIDGELDETSWTTSMRTRAFVNPGDGSSAPFEAFARLLWDDEYLYFGVEVNDTFLTNPHEERDAHLWEHDAVELMINPSGDGRNYFEIQVAPTGQVFDTRYDTRRQPQPIGHADWDSEIEAAVNVEGTVNDEEADTGYTVEARIPFSALATGEPAASAPQANNTWRMNFYVMDSPAGGAPQRAAAWSPTYEGDFHVPGRFGRVGFAGPPAPTREARPGTPTTIPTPQVRLTQEQLNQLQEQIRSQRPSTNTPRPGVPRLPPQ